MEYKQSLLNEGVKQETYLRPSTVSEKFGRSSEVEVNPTRMRVKIYEKGFQSSGSPDWNKQGKE
jgi:hypothetical protein